MSDDCVKKITLQPGGCPLPAFKLTGAVADCENKTLTLSQEDANGNSEDVTVEGAECLFGEDTNTTNADVNLNGTDLVITDSDNNTVTEDLSGLISPPDIDFASTTEALDNNGDLVITYLDANGVIIDTSIVPISAITTVTSADGSVTYTHSDGTSWTVAPDTFSTTTYAQNTSDGVTTTTITHTPASGGTPVVTTINSSPPLNILDCPIDGATQSDVPNGSTVLMPKNFSSSFTDGVSNPDSPNCRTEIVKGSDGRYYAPAPHATYERFDIVNVTGDFASATTPVNLGSTGSSFITELEETFNFVNPNPCRQLKVCATVELSNASYRVVNGEHGLMESRLRLNHNGGGDRSNNLNNGDFNFQGLVANAYNNDLGSLMGNSGCSIVPVGGDLDVNAIIQVASFGGSMNDAGGSFTQSNSSQALRVHWTAETV